MLALSPALSVGFRRNIMLKYTAAFSFVLALAVPLSAHADSPSIKSGTPVIYLADNLDEKDKLGWCIDTEGRGFAETLQSHSCKPAGRGDSDTQFSYHEASGTIQSVPYEGKCMTLSDPENAVWPFGLLDCVPGKESQKFVYDQASMEIWIGSDPSKCVVVATDSIAAGPFMSRDLILADCDSVETQFKQWVVKD